MSMPASPSDPKAAAPAQSSVGHTAESFAESLQLFWIKYGNAILALCALILVGILGYGGYRWYTEQQEHKLGAEYGAAGDNIQKLQEFAATHPGHVLAGVAMLRVADQDFTKGNFAAAQSAYEKAIPALAKQPFGGRAKLGLAMSELLGGKVSEGETALQQIVDDVREFKGIRAEAAYHLLTHYVDLGKKDQALKLAEQVLQIDPSGLWAQRAMLARATLDTGSPAATPAAKPADASGIKLNVPGK